jgi:UDP-N-acetylmuramoyl-tripeptide--D-alanyl-D-alanine ligase
MEATVLLSFVTNVVFVTALGWYLVTNLQWYDYKIERVVLKHHKGWWHVVYFIIPFIAYYATGPFFWILLFFGYLPALFLWHRKLDKKLVMTWRVKRFLILLVSLTLFQNVLCTLKGACDVYGVFLPLAIAYIGSWLIEKYLFTAYTREAKQKLASMTHLKIVCVTGSYGKTSMKNFIAQILGTKYRVYATPRSVNTIGGIVRDINESLPYSTDVYVCEAGARQTGDIYAIAKLLNPQVVVVGKVGPQHIEYFKTLDAIKRTKLELMQSERLERAFVHTSVTEEPHEKVTHFGKGITDLDATLEGTRFSVETAGEPMALETTILGGFQAININAAVLVAQEMGMEDDAIARAVSGLKSVEHRLERIDAGGKIILDDGYNGNIDGMKEGIRLCSLHPGRKVIVTPGLVESTEALNLELIEAINETFDVAIITGALNSALFDRELKVSRKIILQNKALLQELLGKETHSGDIILFANDAPNFV